MAALDLHCGLKPGGHVWGGDRVDLLDSFDSEMQEWEEQLQEMQKKIEELFNEVKARREASTNNITNNKNLDITLLPVSSEYSQWANGYHHGPSAHPNNIRPVHQCSDTAVGPSFGFQHPNDYRNGSKLNQLSNGGHYPASCHDIERQDATLDILNGYLQQGPKYGNIQRNLGVSNANPKMHPGVHGDLENIKTSSVTNRTFEDLENKKNKKANLEESQAHHATPKDSISGRNLPLENFANKQKDAPPVPPRSVHHDSQRQPDRKCLLVDRKSGSPSVLRKFGAMLQENEGKTLIEDGIVTTIIPTECLASTPVCQRKLSVDRASPRMPIQRCLTDCDAELEPSQEPRAAVISRHVLLNGASNASPSHKKASESKAHKMGSEDLFSDYRMVERILGAGSQQYGKVHAGNGADTRWGNDNLEQLLDMMEMENNKSQRATFTQQLDIKQVSRESSPAPSTTSFSRPARPANQRRPTRWATPTPSPKSCPPSPNLKRRQFLNSYSLHTETVIM
ncbi:uncharacterized protein LOC130571923 [Triplophysa rosa]|uniref:SOGA 1/2-like coiled-coil domain-containing protein n=1 Tax=Triplophysa rosa TaxID=992332 RepID=A0A9W7T9Z0_TRIRA|nr:uncharacterized protein LOC130571923 [Triplophysa rosa]XP_057219228.1 uncharacterized protein LOC130571923 [Triplophysa rosa]KAI7794533.1 hypothetical protein IRJ41_015332 [Triplophysa rosa]